MVDKAYLRYAFQDSFGVVASSHANIRFLDDDNELVAACNEAAIVWQQRHGALLTTLRSIESPVSQIERHQTDADSIAVGHFDGSIRIWSMSQRIVKSTFVGHKSPITCLEFSANGQLLASASKDTSIIVWDLVGNLGLYRLEGHKGEVLTVRFAYPIVARATRDKSSDATSPNLPVSITRMSTTPSHIISGSRDTLVKVWDMGTQQCVQTIAVHRAEVNSIVIDPTQSRMYTASSDPCVRVFKLMIPSLAGDVPAVDEETGQPMFAELLGQVPRLTGKGRLVSMHTVYNPAAALEELRNLAEPPPKKRKKLSAGAVSEAAGEFAVASNFLCVAASKKNRWRYAYLRDGGREMIAADIPGLLVAGSPQFKSLECFKLNSASEQIVRRSKRRQRLAEKIRSKKSKIRSRQLELGQLVDLVNDEKTRLLLEEKLTKLSIDLSDLQQMHASVVASASDEITPIVSCPLGAKLCSIDISSDGTKIAMSFQDTTVSVYILDMNQEDSILGKLVCRLTVPGHPTRPKTISFTADDSTIATIGSDLLKLWDSASHRCVKTLEMSQSGLDTKLTGQCGLTVGGHAVVGTKEGRLVVWDINSATAVGCLPAHEGCIQAMAENSQRSGFATVSADKTLKMFDFVLEEFEGGGKRFWVDEKKSCQLSDKGIDVKLSRNNQHVIVSLLDMTIQIFYADSLKLFLTLYGHKLPATSIDVASDSTIIASGSTDTTIKVWGLDFGNIQKSWRAHPEGVAKVKFIFDTHQLVSAGREGTVKIWDCDTRALITQLLGHNGPAWDIALSRDGDRIATLGEDRTIRMWRRTDEQLWLEEEREREMEREIEVTDQVPKTIEIASKPTRRTIEAVKSAEDLIELLDLAWEEWCRECDYRETLALWEASLPNVPKGLTSPKPMKGEPNVLLQGRSPHELALEGLASIPNEDGTEVLLALPSLTVERLLFFVGTLLDVCNETQIENFPMERVCRITLLLVHLHFRSLQSSPAKRPMLLRLHRTLGPIIIKQRERMTFNLAGLELLEKEIKQNIAIF